MFSQCKINLKSDELIVLDVEMMMRLCKCMENPRIMDLGIPTLPCTHDFRFKM